MNCNLASPDGLYDCRSISGHDRLLHALARMHAAPVFIHHIDHGKHMTASHLVIHQIRSLIESGKTPEEVAETVALPARQVTRLMRAYDIRPKRPSGISRAPLHKLMGGR